MNNLLVKTLSRENRSEAISGAPNRRIKLIKAFSMDDIDFMRYPTLTLNIKYNSILGENSIVRSFASFIDPYQANSRVVEFENMIFPAGTDITLEIQNRGQSANLDYKVGIAYEFI